MEAQCILELRKADLGLGEGALRLQQVVAAAGERRAAGLQLALRRSRSVAPNAHLQAV